MVDCIPQAHTHGQVPTLQLPSPHSRQERTGNVPLRSITKEAPNLEAEKAHLSGALQWNGYPAAFVRAASQESKPREHDPEESQGEGKPTLMMLPYVAGVNVRIRKACWN